MPLVILYRNTHLEAFCFFSLPQESYGQAPDQQQEVVRRFERDCSPSWSSIGSVIAVH